MLLNRDRALGIMKEFGVDALLATTPVNVAYLSDFTAWLHWFYRLYTRENYWIQTYALLPRDQPPALLPSIETMAYLAESSHSWIEDIYPLGFTGAGSEPPADYPPEFHRLHRLNKIAAERGCKTAGEAIVKALRDRGLTCGVVGIDTVGIHPAQLEYAREELPHVLFKEAGELFRYVRMVKTPEEIDLLRKSAEINQMGLEAVLKAAVPGATELDLARAHRSAVSQFGAMPAFCNNPCGPWALAQWQPRPNVLKSGDTIYCDAGCTYEYYHSDGNIVGIIGEITQRHRDLFEAQMEGITTAMAKARPGVKASEMLAGLLEGELRSGILKRSSGYGHALGLEARDFPVVRKPFGTAADEIFNVSHDVTLEAGMVFNLETAQRKAGIGTVAVEVTAVTTATGCEFLVPPPKLWELTG